MKKNELLEIGLVAAERAAKILKENFGRPVSFHEKSDRQLVSTIDLKAEETIIKTIKKYFPQHSILSEENSQLNDLSEYKWIIDPIDGTHNYLKGIRIFGSSIALEYKKEIILGIINIPLERKIYFAQKHKGAFCNEKKISVSKRNLSQATITYDSSIRYYKEDMLKLLGVLSDKVFNLRMFGSTVESLVWVASGSLEAEIEFSDKPWDFAAGAFMVEEAGGIVTDLKGNPWSPYIPHYVAANQTIHNALLDIIKEADLILLRPPSSKKLADGVRQAVWRTP